MVSSRMKVAREVFTFRHFARKSYALFSVLGREVRVGVLSVATLATAAPCLAQASAPQTNRSAASAEASDTLELGTAWVTAPPAVSRVADIAAVQVQVLSREELQAAGVTSVNDALKLATGVDVRQRGAFGIQTDISIDGGTFDQVAYFVNGFPVGNPQTGHNAADFPVNISDIERIEVIEGAAASIYGSQAFSGGVNVVTREGAPSRSAFGRSQGENLPRDGEAHKASKGSFGGYGTIAAGSYGTFLAEARAELLPRSGEAGRGLSLSLSYRRSDGAVENGDFEGAKAFWQGHVQGRNFRLSAQVGATLSDFGANTFYSAAYPRQWEATSRYHVGLRAETEGIVRLVPEFSWMRNVDHFQLVRGTSTGENFHRGDVFVGGLRAYAPWKTDFGLHGTTFASAEARRENIVSSNIGRPMEAKECFSHYTRSVGRTNLSLSLGQSLTWERWSLCGSLLLTSEESLNTSLFGRMSFFPGIDLAFRPSNAWRLTASWHKTLRLPTFTDLFYKSPTQEGNVGLRSEKNSTLRVGADFRTSVLQLRASAFASNGTDMIDWVMYAPDDVFHSANFKLRKVGFSLSASVDVLPLLSIASKKGAFCRLESSYSYIHQHRSDDEPIYKSNYALEYLRHKFVLCLEHSVFSHLSASWCLRLQQREGAYILYRDAQSTGELRPYGTHAILDAKLRWQRPRYEVYLEAQNLTATRYYDLANVPQPGFFLLAGVKVRI